MTLILRKLLASSSFAIAGTLRALADRLRENPVLEESVVEDTFEEDFEYYDEISDEWKDVCAPSTSRCLRFE
jgi:hypothetical protein